MSLTSTPLYCPECGCQQIEAHKSYPVKAGGVRQLYYCPECKGYFSETHNTPLANLKTPLSRIIPQTEGGHHLRPVPSFVGI